VNSIPTETYEPNDCGLGWVHHRRREGERERHAFYADLGLFEVDEMTGEGEREGEGGRERRRLQQAVKLLIQVVLVHTYLPQWGPDGFKSFFGKFYLFGTLNSEQDIDIKLQ